MLIKREKLYQDKYFDIRDYELKEARKKKEDIICIYKGKNMTLTPKQQKERGILFNKTAIKSKVYPDQLYYLYSFLFESDKELTEDEKLEQMGKDGVFG